MIENRPDLSPRGPFTLEMWIKPKPELMPIIPRRFCWTRNTSPRRITN